MAAIYRPSVTGRSTGHVPVIHASTGQRRTPKGKTLRALCGAGVYESPAFIRAALGQRFDVDQFDPDHGASCPRCSKLAKAEGGAS